MPVHRVTGDGVCQLSASDADFVPPAGRSRLEIQSDDDGGGGAVARPGVVMFIEASVSISGC